jgi:hypothetical protein
MDISQFGQGIAILASIAGLIWGFLSQGWPRIVGLRVRQKKRFLVNHLKKNIYRPERQKLYQLLEECNNSIKICKKHDLHQDEDNFTRIKKKIQNFLGYKVRLYMLLNETEKKDCSLLTLKQNMIQNMFTFELGETIGLEPGIVKEKKSLRTYVEKWKDEIKKKEHNNEAQETTKNKEKEEILTRIIVTSTPLPRNYYLWGHFPSKTHKLWDKPQSVKFWVLSPFILKKTLPDIPTEQIVLRIIQRICALSAIPQLKSQIKPAKPFDRFIVHRTTKGCLFDFTNNLIDARYFIQLGLICPDCSNRILENSVEPYGYRNAFLSNLSKWLLDTCNLCSIDRLYKTTATDKPCNH